MKAPDGVYRGGGNGWGTRIVADSTYLTRFLSVNEGWVRVVEKARPGLQSIFDGRIEAVQRDFKLVELGISRLRASGFIAQGFVPFDETAYIGRYSPISSEDVLGVVKTERSVPVQRGSWQLPPAAALGRLREGDEVVLVTYDIGAKFWRRK
jgi:hypothetical protein